jgi:hypothetical protein
VVPDTDSNPPGIVYVDRLETIRDHHLVRHGFIVSHDYGPATIGAACGQLLLSV